MVVLNYTRGSEAILPITETQVREALKTVYDPEIPVNIVDLGLVYQVRFKPAMQVASELATAPAEPLEDVEVDMTLTSPGCPSHVTIGESVKRTVEALPGVQSTTVNFVWTPQWGPERISPEGREKLGIEV
jgi:metal-sulfur cluster biosynthetic enzyme